MDNNKRTLFKTAPPRSLPDRVSGTVISGSELERGLARIYQKRKKHFFFARLVHLAFAGKRGTTGVLLGRGIAGVPPVRPPTGMRAIPGVFEAAEAVPEVLLLPPLLACPPAVELTARPFSSTS